MSTLKEPGTGKPAGKPAKAGKKRKYTLAIVVMAAVVLFGGGFLTANLTADPTASDEYIEMDALASKASGERDSIDAQRLRLEETLAEQQAAMTERENAVVVQEAAVKTKEEESAKTIAEREDAVKKREDAVVGAEQKQAANTIADGTWVVGVDIEPGVYRTKSDVGSSCYWAILASGTNGDDIIANDIPGGGFPTVTLAAGQDFKSSRCGAWVKQ
ncbi:hypothetical protein ART_2359 [Arthrobacter sp. PAMC 25486]|uniref:hypothetical protein n=1 Tax=Arthrobacter sp. PAMC 25486 TaxID=1494608 RepID=UPI0005363CD3|nr:hypothetical protein [Arthrobacter sp. PAMC 25486]AIY01958.1 hypothetical protein ART_2359 [Arthrobacter sp. PAMC 25486]